MGGTGVGIRIEDDIAVTTGDPEIFSGDLPVDAEGVESIVQSTSYPMPLMV